MAAIKNFRQKTDWSILGLRIMRVQADRLKEISIEYAIPQAVLIRKAIQDLVEKEYPLVSSKVKARKEQAQEI